MVANPVPVSKRPMSSPGRRKRPWTLAAPSCVLPAGVAENCAFLAQGFDEIALAFFETEACLSYTEQDLPPGLAHLPVSWHIHLPLDLPWAAGAGRVAEITLALLDKAAHLSPQAFVLHPPLDMPAGSMVAATATMAELAHRLETAGIAPSRVLVENISGRDLERLWPVIESAGFGVCLDLGHMLVHGQQDFLDLPGLAARTAMVHLNAPDPQKPARHASLSLLSDAGTRLCLRLLQTLAPGGVVVLELFNADALADSLRVLDALSAGGGAKMEERA